jgi:hypothetical protein
MTMLDCSSSTKATMTDPIDTAHSEPERATFDAGAVHVVANQ